MQLKNLDQIQQKLRKNYFSEKAKVYFGADMSKCRDRFCLCSAKLDKITPEKVTADVEDRKTTIDDDLVALWYGTGLATDRS